VREARLFKYGSGTGTNFFQSARRRREARRAAAVVRLMSFLKIATGAAARSSRRHHAGRRQDVIVDTGPSGHRAVHRLEVKEEQRWRRSSPAPRSTEAPARDPESLRQLRRLGDDCFSPDKTPRSSAEVNRAAQSCRDTTSSASSVARQGYRDIEFSDLRHDWDSEGTSRFQARTRTIRCA